MTDICLTPYRGSWFLWEGLKGGEFGSGDAQERTNGAGVNTQPSCQVHRLEALVGEHEDPGVGRREQPQGARSVHAPRSCVTSDRVTRVVGYAFCNLR